MCKVKEMEYEMPDDHEECQYCHAESSSWDMRTFRGRTMCQDCYDIACDMEYEAMKDARMEEML